MEALRTAGGTLVTGNSLYAPAGCGDAAVWRNYSLRNPHHYGNGGFEVEWMSIRIRIDRPISLRVRAEWLEALDRWRERQPVKPSRSAVIVAAVKLFVTSQKESSISEG
jgi:hypothetical protein